MAITAAATALLMVIIAGWNGRNPDAISLADV